MTNIKRHFNRLQNPPASGETRGESRGPFPRQYPSGYNGLRNDWKTVRGTYGAGVLSL